MKKLIVAALSAPVVVFAGLASADTLATFTFTPNQGADIPAISFDAPLVETLNTNFTLTNVNVCGNYCAGYADVITNVYAFNPGAPELEVYLGGIVDAHFQTSGTQFATVSGNTVTFAPGVYSVVQPYSKVTEGTLTIDSAAPEPASWALMMIGVGGMGAALRTRRRKACA